ncbi:MAG: hypothetical protein IKY52_12015 [Clostridia bacterium]|nr:hypothetical protein [Clostridia bacterium]
MAEFTIRGENYHWIDKAEDNVTDLCLHGHVTVAIGNTVLTGDGNVSAAALLLLKSLTEDHTPGEIQMVPCCGHFWCPDEALENVTIIGCDKGLDWTVAHENGAVRLTAMDGETVFVDEYAYLEEVLRFAENVDRYFSHCPPRLLPEDPFTRNGYAAFRNEWNRWYRAGARTLFREFVRKGHGAAHARLEHLEDADAEDYADILIDAMASEQRYDRQGNRDRTVYLLDLYDLFPAPEKELILRTVLDRHMQIDYQNMFTYAPLLKGFAGRGVTEAGEILKKLYNHYRTALENRAQPPDGYDELGGMVEHLAWELDIRPHSWEQPEPEKRTQAPPMTIETVIEHALNRTSSDIFHPARYRDFLCVQPPEKIAQLAEAVKTVDDPDIKVRLYSLFDVVKYPGDPAEMITLLKERMDALKSWVAADDDAEKQRRLGAMCLVRALALLHHPAVRTLALKMVEMSKRQANLRIYALDLWCANFDEKTDVDRMMDFLEKRPSGEEYTYQCHDEDMSILQNLYTRKYEDPRMYGIPVRIYMETYCSTCRHTAVEILARHGMLQEGLRRQCLWDCELSTRELAKEMEGKTI